MKPRSLKRALTIAVGLCVASLVVSAAAFAAEVSRDEYVEQLEPICQTNTQANERIFAGAKREVREGKLKKPAASFTKASTALKKALVEIEAVPRPSADEARLANWFGLIKKEAELFAAAGTKLKAGDKAGAEHVVTQLTQNANKANLEVLPFGFRYCRLEPAKFT